MGRKERRFLGDLDAETDPSFANHFVESPDLHHIHNPQSNIVYGSKGVGKTALRRALTELNRQSYFHTKTINLDQISFAQVHDALSDLRDTSKTEVATLARNTWRNVLAMYSLEAAAESLPEEHRHVRGQIFRLLHEEGFSASDSNNRLLGHIERLFLLVAEAGIEQDTPTPLGLTSKQRGLINNFPSNPAVKQLLEQCVPAIARSGRVILICLDGFDSIVDHTPESRRAIFAGLIDAIHKCSRDPLLSRAFCYKAFLPQELTEAAHVMVWDADKFVQNTHYLKWSKEDFQNLIRKRLLPYAKTKSSQFNDVWRQFMPSTVRNEAHRVDESTAGYILRHTLYRPRQVLTHLQAILDQWDERSDVFRVDPTFIPPVVARTNYNLARMVVNQLEVAHPGLAVFMQSWGGSPNIVTVADFQNRLTRMFELQAIQETDNLFDNLFNLGIFGICQKPSMTRGAFTMRFKFSFVGDRISPNIHASLESSDLVAISPMFHEYCGCNPSEWGAVIPVAA